VCTGTTVHSFGGGGGGGGIRKCITVRIKIIIPLFCVCFCTTARPDQLPKHDEGSVVIVEPQHRRDLCMLVLKLIQVKLFLRFCYMFSSIWRLFV